MAHDPQKIINTANSFLLAADRALEQRPLEPGQFQSNNLKNIRFLQLEQRPLEPGQFQMLLVPAVVSTAFAVELYFKAIITLENGNTRGHDLSALFKHISATSQATLVAGVQHNHADFEQKLGAISSVFVEWRYIFEQQSADLDFQFLTNLAREAQRVADEMAN